jgi:hypothetical protein
VEVREWIAEGRLNAQSEIKPQGKEEWVKLSSLLEFAADLNPQAVTPSPAPESLPPLPQPQPKPQPAAHPAPPATYTPAPKTGTNPMAITGMICGIISLPTLCCSSGVPFNILGIVFSLIGLSQLKVNPQQQGKGMATAGLICSILSVLLIGILILLGVAIGISNP